MYFIFNSSVSQVLSYFTEVNYDSVWIDVQYIIEYLCECVSASMSVSVLQTAEHPDSTDWFEDLWERKPF